jgi:hypothetical protein
MEILEPIGKPAEYIVAIFAVLGSLWAGITYIPKGYRWLRSWAFINREELKRLKDSEAELERLRKLDNPLRREILAQINAARQQPVRMETEFDPRGLFRDRK